MRRALGVLLAVCGVMFGFSAFSAFSPSAKSARVIAYPGVEGSAPPAPAVVRREQGGSAGAARVARDRVVALTFDDGPDIRYTPLDLQILRDKNVRATFFMIGDQVEKHPELAMEAFMDGNEIGNHTYSHPDMKKLSWADTVREISKAQDVLVRVLGFRPIYFRPPRGEFDNQDLEVAKAMGYKVVMWTVGVENHLMITPQAMVDRVCSKVRSGSVILMHDGSLDRSRTVAALPLLIDKLRLMGYSLVTVSDLLVAMGPKRASETDVVDYHKHFPLKFPSPLPTKPKPEPKLAP